MLTALLNWLGSYITYFPLVVFVGLLLGGLWLPISEDLLVVMSAVLCQGEKASIPSFLCALYVGAILSDFMVYFWGRLIAKGTLSLGLFSRVITKENTLRLSKALQKHGVLTYVFTRFIPFGVRNIVSTTTGFVKYPFYKFAVYDSIAVLCNVSALFGLVYFFGAKGGHIMRTVGIVLFVVFWILSIYMVKSGKLFQFADKKMNDRKVNG